jgi:DNA-binding NtrC family response regulator
MTSLLSRPGLQGLKILLVDDEADIRLGLRRLLEPLGAEIREAASGKQALQLLREMPAQLVITDLRMPVMSGEEVLEQCNKQFPETAVVVITGFGTIPIAVSCLQKGARHFLCKPFQNEEIVTVVGRIGQQLHRQSAPADASESSTRSFVAKDPRMLRLLALVERVAPLPVPVLIQGESGTGKELIARLLHEKSKIADRPFLALNAAALPDALLESELFGHRKGAFTGADRNRAGLFKEVRGGTLFLDEVSSMSLAFQAKLLRVLQERMIRPLGDGQDVEVDFRLVSASNQDLEERVGADQFREDLLYRLRVVTLQVPALRERPADIAPLAQTFLQQAAQVCLDPGVPVPALGPEALLALQRYPFPGNVRELQNLMQRALVIGRGESVQPHHLGLDEAPPADAVTAPPSYESGKKQAIERFQRDYLCRMLQESQGNISQAADACGLTRAALQRILRQLNIDRSEFLEKRSSSVDA